MATTPEVKLAEEELVTPHVITLPSLFNAANELALEKRETTPEVKLAATELEFPP
jgi:hypothetical protein